MYERVPEREQSPRAGDRVILGRSGEPGVLVAVDVEADELLRDHRASGDHRAIERLIAKGRAFLTPPAAKAHITSAARLPWSHGVTILSGPDAGKSGFAIVERAHLEGDRFIFVGGEATAEDKAQAESLKPELIRLLTEGGDHELTPVPDEIATWYDSMSPFVRRGFMMMARLVVRAKPDRQLSDVLLQLAAIWQAEKARQVEEVGHA
jgi:hypothetical protein